MNTPIMNTPVIGPLSASQPFISPPIINADTKHIVCYSGGDASAQVAVAVALRYGTKNMVLLNHNINRDKEGMDIKRFKQEVADYIGLPVTFANIDGIEDDRDLPDQFDVCVKRKAFKVGVGTEFCTTALKTEPFRAWLKANCPDKNVVCYYGFEAHEPDRISRRHKIMNAAGYQVCCPLAEWDQAEFAIPAMAELGIELPDTYETWKHGNCVGCLKAGWQHWYAVFCLRPDIWEKGKWAEAKIGYSIHRDEYLKDREERFAVMKAAGVLPSEHTSKGDFAKMKNQALKQYAKRLPVLTVETTEENFEYSAAA